MEYVQTVLVQIEAQKIDDASQTGGLFNDLDEHRAYLERQPGFEEMRVTRSVNPQGNALLVVETRWADAESLVQYETREPNVASIVSKHERLIVPNSLQVLDMEALRAGRRRVSPGAEATERVALPLLIPTGILAFALLVIYGLSRIYLEVPNEVATGLAAAIAVGIILVAWLITARPEVSGWQIGVIGTVAAAVLLGGALFAVVHEEGGAEEGPPAADETPTGDQTPTADETPTGPPSGELAISMGDNFFEFEGEMAPTITASAGEEVTIQLTNDGLTIHNMHVAGADNEYAIALCDDPEPDGFCSQPNAINAGEEGSLTFSFDQTGEFVFRCDFHPIDMVGTIRIE